jgi:pimeloyl-ACP methyl ester carboxylesterase
VDPPRRSESHLALFPPGTERRVVAGAGHFLPRERPGAVVDALLALDRR